MLAGLLSPEDHHQDNIQRLDPLETEQFLQEEETCQSREMEPLAVVPAQLHEAEFLAGAGSQLSVAEPSVAVGRQVNGVERLAEADD